MYLQERLIDLNSGIIDKRDNKIFVTGFMSPERLLDFLSTREDCRFSVGVYDIEDYDIAYVKDNSLFVIKENGKEIERYNFVPIFKDVAKFKHKNDSKTKTFRIRKCLITNKYCYSDMEVSKVFDDITSVKAYLLNEYSYLLEI